MSKSTEFEEQGNELTLKEIFEDQMMNEQLDLEHFNNSAVIKKCREDKDTTSLLIMKRYRKKHIWKPNYAKSIPRNVRANLNLNQ